MSQTYPELSMPASPRWLDALASRFKKYLKLLVILLMIAAAAVFTYEWWGKGSTASSYLTSGATRGNVEVDVTATGTAQAVTTVQVGTQVSGTVAWLGADYKSHVRKGQVIAKLDPALFQAQVDSARANLVSAEAAVKAAASDIGNQTSNVSATVANQAANQAERDDAIALAQADEKLRGVISDREIEAAEAQARVAIAKYNQATAQIGSSQAVVQSSRDKVQQAQAAVGQAQALLAQAELNLQHTVITSPIDGVVVSRNVDVGQTVQASLQAPTLFTIANDLKEMQVLAAIDEADVGQVREGSTANFTVDAYPGQSFSGKISQVRLNAQSQQNVVTYTAVINVANPDEKLLPGMTANITVPVARRESVLTIPNAALRFKPALSDQEQQALRDQKAAGQQQPAAGSATQAARGGQQSAGGSQSGRGASPAPAAQGNGQARQTIWVLAANKKLEPHVVFTGLTDGRVTEIASGDLKEGDVVVTGQTGAAASAKPSQPASPFGQQRAGGGGGGRGR